MIYYRGVTRTAKELGAEVDGIVYGEIFAGLPVIIYYVKSVTGEDATASILINGGEIYTAIQLTEVFEHIGWRNCCLVTCIN